MKSSVAGEPHLDIRMNVAVVLVLAVTIGLIGYRSYVAHKRALEEDLHRELSEIADLKVNQVAAWRLERVGDATVVIADAQMMSALQEVLKGRETAEATRRVLAWMDAMRTNYQYVNIVLSDTEGKMRLASGSLLGSEEAYKHLATEAANTEGVLFRDVAAEAGIAKPHFVLGVALRMEDGKKVGSLLLGVDPWVHFYQVILKWPSRSRTGEALLVRRDGDDVIYLSEFRRIPDAVMKLRRSLSIGFCPAVRAVLGKEGKADGVDASGTKVMAWAKRVPEASWYIVAKEDEEEAYAPLKEARKRILVIVGLLLAMCSTGVGLIWRQQVSTFYRHMYEAERKRHALSGHYDYLTRFANDAILLVDEEGNILEVNDRATESFGYSIEEFSRLNVRDLRAPEELERFQEEWEELQERKSLVFETQNRRKDGSKFATEISVRLLEVDGKKYIQGIIRDTSERKRAEAALRESAERFKAIFDHAGIGIALVDMRGYPIKCNSALEKMLGYGSEELKKMAFTDFTHEEDRKLDWELYNELTAGQREKYAIEKRYVKKGGGEVWGFLTVSLVKDSQGRPEYAVGMVEDVTERKKLEEQFRQSQKLESIGKLAGGVAHDFNNLLMVINGYSDVLLARLEESDPNRKQVEEILRAGNRATSLTQQLLAFSRKQMSQPQPLNLNAVVLESEKLLSRLVNEDIELITQLLASPDRIMADASQLNQVLMNLVVNARDAMPEGGKLIIETSNAEVGVPEAPDELPGPYVLLSVSDTGVGMSEATLGQLFEPFFTTKGKGKGTGLGLSTVYGIVRQSGGFIRVHSAEGQGATFSIYLPPTEALVSHAERIALNPSQLRGSEVILVVEDQDNVRELVMETLRSYGYSVLGAANGREALVLSGYRPEPIDLLLTDVVMPGMDGKTLAEKLRRTRPGTRVIYMSGYSDEVISHRGVLEPGVEHLTKPFAPEMLAAKVREVLDAPATRPTILVVDDEEGIRHLFQDLLGGSYKVLLASDGKEALRIIRRAEPLDLVITDLVMPNQEGIETIQALRKQHAKIRIIAMSGAFEGQFLKTAKFLGADATLAKPIEPKTLRDTIGEVLSRVD